jgi:hypothetical protein
MKNIVKDVAEEEVVKGEEKREQKKDCPKDTRSKLHC